MLLTRSCRTSRDDFRDLCRFLYFTLAWLSEVKYKAKNDGEETDGEDIDEMEIEEDDATVDVSRDTELVRRYINSRDETD